MKHQIRLQKCSLERRIWKSPGSDSIEDCVRESGRLRKQPVLTPVLALATALEIELQGMKETEMGLFIDGAQWLEPPPIGDLGFYSQQNSQSVVQQSIKRQNKHLEAHIR